MLTTLKKFLAPPVFEDEEKSRMARILAFITLPAMMLLSLFVFLARAIYGQDFPNITYLVLLIGALGAVFLLNRWGWVRTASFLLVAGSWIMLTLQSWQAGGLYDLSFIAHTIIIVLTYVLLGWPVGLGLTVLSVLAGWGLAYAQETGVLSSSVDAPYKIALGASVIFFLLALIVSIPTNSLRQALRRARENENKLAERNQELLTLRGTLEQQVAQRTYGLETVAAIGEHLSATLDVSQVLVQLVKRVKEDLNYYHVHIYLFDDNRQNLVLAEGAGPAGQAMKAQKHSIPVATTSLVARAARSSQTVRVDNVREAADWLPNPLLPDTRSEMAVPIIVDGSVVGVLDVQSAQLAGLTDTDAYLLRSLTNQVAVAVRNARLFEQVEKALAEARLSQERYVEQAWAKIKLAAKTGEHVYVQPGTLPPPPETLAAATRQVAARRRPVIVAGPGDSAGHTAEVIVAPVILKDKVIGALQLHRAGHGEPTRLWTEREISLVETVLDQVAQAAENLRLIDDAQERATLESTVTRITARLRQAPSLDLLAKVAAEELGQALDISHSVVKIGRTLPAQPAPTPAPDNGKH